MPADALPLPAAPISENRLLAALPPAEAAALRPHLQPVRYAVHQRVHLAHAPCEQLYFPRSGICSQVVRLADGRGVEVGIIGREGVVGATILVPRPTSPYEALAQVASDGVQ